MTGGPSSVTAGGGDAPLPPFPRAKVLVCCLINLLNTASYLMTMPFVPRLILHLFPGLPTKEVGYYSGVLEGTFSVGAVLGAVFWGWFADRYGRRPAALLGLAGTIISSLGFGLSTTYGQAAFFRFTWGALNGNVGVVKTMLSEIVDDVHSPRAFSYLGLNAGIGRIVGPALGGLLSPATDLPGLAGIAFFEAVPFCLPSFVAAAATAAVAVWGYYVLEETLPQLAYKPLKQAEQAQVAQEDEEEEEEEGDAEAQAARAEQSQSAAATADKIEVRTDKPDSAARSGATTSHAAAAALPARGGFGFGGVLQLFWRDRLVRDAVNIYSLLGLLGTTSTEVWAVWALNDARHGGFSLSSRDMGFTAAAAGPGIILSQLYLYPWAVERYGFMTTMRTSFLWLAVGTALTPLVSLASLLESREAQLAVINAHFILVSLARVSAFTGTFVIVANSALPHQRGAVNGIAQSVVSVARAVGPPIGTALFAWTVSSQPLAFPFGYGFTWLLLAALGWYNLHMTYALPDSIARKRAAEATVA